MTLHNFFRIAAYLRFKCQLFGELHFLDGQIAAEHILSTTLLGVLRLEIVGVSQVDGELAVPR